MKIEQHILSLVVKGSFEAAHVLDRSETPACSETIHGHSYHVEVTLGFPRSVPLNEDGVLIDFSRIKKRVNEVCDRYDHALLLPNFIEGRAHMPRMKKVVLFDCNPTAENIVQDFIRTFTDDIEEKLGLEERHIPGEMLLLSVRLWETDKAAVESTVWLSL